MESINYLKEQVKHYQRCVDIAEKDRDDLKIELDKAEYQYKTMMEKLNDFQNLLSMVEKDFKQYGWNPAG